MADTFTTSLSIRQIETGTRSGTWGTETNTQYELFDNAFSYVANDLASDADATLTISDGTASNARYFYIKFTSSVSLTATRTITLAPDDSKKIWIVENATTGSQSLTFKQGSSGSTVTVSNGNTAMIYADGAGATNGAIENVLSNIQISDSIDLVGSTPTLTIGDGGAEDTKLVFDGNAQDFYVGLDDSADDLVIGLGSTVGTTPALSVDENQLATFHAGVTLTGTTPTLTIGDAGEEDTKIVFDGNAQDYYVGLDDSADDLKIGLGSAVGTTPAITVGSDQSVDFAKGIVVEGSGTTAGVYLNGTNSDTATNGNYVRFGTNFATQSNAANDVLITKAFNGSTFVDALNVKSDGNVGINDTAPGEKLSVTSGDNTSSTNIARFAANNDTLAIGIGYESIRQTETGGVIKFETNGSERARILSTGGLTFNGDTAAANALDDYEEGTWTPAYSSNGGLGTVTGITSASGFYIKIGNLVHLYGTFSMNGSSGTRINNGDFLRITGLPYSDGYSTLTAPGNVYTSRAFTNLGGFSGICYYYANSYMVVQFLGQASATWSGDEDALVKLELTFTDNLPY